MYFISQSASEFKYTAFNICDPTTAPLFVCSNEKCVATVCHPWNKNRMSNLSRVYYSKIFTESCFLLPQTLYSSIFVMATNTCKVPMFLFFSFSFPSISLHQPVDLSTSLEMRLNLMTTSYRKINVALERLNKTTKQ